MFKIPLQIVAAGCLLILMSFMMQKERVTLYIIGDSTAANKVASAYPETGWGMALQAFFNPDVLVDNRALNGRSTKSFLTENRWQPIVDQLKAGDYVFIEFGHNDEKVDKPGVGTSLSEFKANLTKYVLESRAKKAIPVLLTPITRRSFEKGVLINSHGQYPDVVRQLADSLHVPLIDMQEKTAAMVNQLGELPSQKLFNYVDSGHVNYPQGRKDNTHLSPEGARAFAALVVLGIRERKLSLVQQLLP
jgi:lysophospholipase L1-like esterase